MLRIGVDTGGTFTDFVIFDSGKVRSFKLPSTPGNPSEAVLEGLGRAADGAGEKLVRHGSTVATNALLQRKGAKTALITNQGFEDVLEIGRQNRPGLYQLHGSKAVPLVPAGRRIGVKQRTLHDGSKLISLEQKSLDWLLSKIRQLNVESIAVALLYSYLTPDDEVRIAAALGETGIPISLSHKILPEFREYERTCATVVNAYVNPTMTAYLQGLTKDPSLSGTKLTVMQSNGGSISAEAAAAEPVRTLLSGPAGGVVGAFRVAQRVGYEKIITFDMGGTSTDVCLCDGEITTTNEAQIDNLPIPIQTLGIHTIGAGGGSIAHVDSGGLLKVGPESAGADPGPAVYGKGEQATVTDAHIYLGQLQADFFLGGEFQLDTGRVEPALEKLISELGRHKRGSLDMTEVAEGIISIVTSQMESAIRVISLQRGYDTRDFTLVSFGGCGALHACRLAQALMIPRVLVPADPGLLSAAGVLFSDITRDASRTVMLKPSPEAGSQEIQEGFQSLEVDVFRELERQGFDRGSVDVTLSADVRYPGQAYEINVEYDENYIQRFHERHEQFYGYSNPNLDVEIVTLRVRGTGVGPKPEPERREIESEFPVPEALLQEKQVVMDGSPTSCRIFLRDKLKPGNRIDGPAVIVEYSSTTLLPKGCRARVDEWLNLVIQTGAEQ